MEQFFKDLGKRIENALKTEIPQILKKTRGETIYTAALVTDSDCITLYFACNTCEALKKADAKDAKRRDLPEGCAEGIREGRGSLTKWMTDEWKYSDGTNSSLNEISDLLYDYSEGLDGDDETRARYGALFLETVTRAFQNVIAENIFGEGSDKITYFLSMSDDERIPVIEDYSAKLLNPRPMYEEFLKRNEFLEEFFGKDDSSTTDIPEEFSYKTLMDNYFGIH